jgi:hypothetical protein
VGLSTVALFVIAELLRINWKTVGSILARVKPELLLPRQPRRDAPRHWANQRFPSSVHVFTD